MRWMCLEIVIAFGFALLPRMEAVWEATYLDHKPFEAGCGMGQPLQLHTWFDLAQQMISKASHVESS